MVVLSITEYEDYTMNVYISDETMGRLKLVASELDRTPEDIAEAAIEQAVMDYFRGRSDDPALELV